jgi:hypothetical protein
MSINSKRRHALAPLEMVLALPFLLMILALIICYGNLACWKVRSLAIARHSIWGNLSPALHSPSAPYDRKTGFNDQRPKYWPAEKTVEAANSAGNARSTLDFEQPRQPVVRGESDANPVLDIGDGKRVEVNIDLLDPSRGMREGASDLVHVYPMLKKLGNFHLRAETQTLDDAWRSAEMGICNHCLRLPLIYPEFMPPETNNPVMPVLMKIYNSIHSQKLLALLFGLDPDFQKFQMLYGRSIPMFIQGIPGWTSLHFGCTADPAVVEQAVDDLIERIQGSRKMAGPLASLSNALKGYYQSVQAVIKAQMQADPRPSAEKMAELQRDYDMLEGYIKLIDQFIASLR